MYDSGIVTQEFDGAAKRVERAFDERAPRLVRKIFEDVVELPERFLSVNCLERAERGVVVEGTEPCRARERGGEVAETRWSRPFE